MYLWCIIEKNMPKIQVLFWNVINKVIFRLNKVSFEKGLRTRGRKCYWSRSCCDKERTCGTDMGGKSGQIY